MRYEIALEFRRPTLLTLARSSLWLGIAGFGGGFVIVQQFKRLAVDKYHWLDEDSFFDAFAVASALPGTPSTNFLTIVGVRLLGTVGGVVAATAFLVPSVSVMIAFAAAYDWVRNVSAIATFLDGMSVATVGVIASVAVDIGRSALRRWDGWILAAISAVALITHALSLVQLVGSVAFYGALLMRPTPSEASSRHERSNRPPSTRSAAFALPLKGLLASPMLPLLLVFARIGMVTFGGAFAMIPAIEHEVVNHRHWLSMSAFNDAMVIGQVTPGPIAIAATFIGYRIAGLGGALTSTIGMFGPAAILSLIAGKSLGFFHSNPVLQGALRAIAAALVGIMIAAAVAVGKTSIHGVTGALVAAAAAITLIVARRLLPVIVLVAGGLVMTVFAQ